MNCILRMLHTMQSQCLCYKFRVNIIRYEDFSNFWVHLTKQLWYFCITYFIFLIRFRLKRVKTTIHVYIVYILQIIFQLFNVVTVCQTFVFRNFFNQFLQWMTNICWALIGSLLFSQSYKNIFIKYRSS